MNLKKHLFPDIASDGVPDEFRKEEGACKGLFLAKVASYSVKKGQDGKKDSYAFACPSAELIAEGGEVVARSNVMYLPGAGEMMLRGLLDEAGAGTDPETGDAIEGNALIEVAFEVWTRPDPKSQVGYVWEVSDLVDRSAHDPLKDLRAKYAH